jgi:hypothetical protein
MENVLEHEGDMSLLQNSFVDAHPIIYWNLVWYFERTNLPTHLPALILPPDVSCISRLFFSCSRQTFQVRETHDASNVRVICFWDNDRLHEDMIKPMYKSWLEQSKFLPPFV